MTHDLGRETGVDGEDEFIAIVQVDRLRDGFEDFPVIRPAMTPLMGFGVIDCH